MQCGLRNYACFVWLNGHCTLRLTRWRLFFVIKSAERNGKVNLESIVPKVPHQYPFSLLWLWIEEAAKSGDDAIITPTKCSWVEMAARKKPLFAFPTQQATAWLSRNDVGWKREVTAIIYPIKGFSLSLMYFSPHYPFFVILYSFKFRRLPRKSCESWHGVGEYFWETHEKEEFYLC